MGIGTKRCLSVFCLIAAVSSCSVLEDSSIQSLPREWHSLSSQLNAYEILLSSPLSGHYYEYQYSHYNDQEDTSTKDYYVDVDQGWYWVFTTTTTESILNVYHAIENRYDVYEFDSIYPFHRRYSATVELSDIFPVAMDEEMAHDVDKFPIETQFKSLNDYHYQLAIPLINAQKDPLLALKNLLSLLGFSNTDMQSMMLHLEYQFAADQRYLKIDSQLAFKTNVMSHSLIEYEALGTFQAPILSEWMNQQAALNANFIQKVDCCGPANELITWQREHYYQMALSPNQRYRLEMNENDWHGIALYDANYELQPMEMISFTAEGYPQIQVVEEGLYYIYLLTTSDTVNVQIMSQLR